jgi:branched-chain amino acid transport system permease protein
MMIARNRGEAIAILAVACAMAVPFLTSDPFVYSVANQVAIAITASFSVYLMLRMNLLTFAVPAFMAIGGYAVSIAGLRFGLTDSILLTLISFAVPGVVALPLGALVLRLRGVYFVLVTFLLTEITQLVLFETPSLTGGSNGLVGMPATTLFGIELSDNQSVLALAIGLALVAALVTAVASIWYRQQFAAIEENELLAQSLGLVVWRYKVIGFVLAAGLAGMAGFSLVNMLLTAHPSSFTSASSVNYIAYVIIGGRYTMLGTVLGSTLLVWMANVFNAQGQLSQGLFGLLLIVVVLAARGGITGTVAALARRTMRARRPAPALTRAAEKETV